MNEKKSKAILINFLFFETCLVLLIFCIGFLFGTYRYIFNNKPEIQQIPEINNHIPVLEIEKLSENHFKGYITGGQVRIEYDSEIYVFMDGEEFEF